ncbi:L,D-transpeptidase family protein [Flaviaesturariibacter amylovorans]|uniref:L,D-TPase catalytic domain-containing protein n=1 Tax=Flaviaesturariibacter amylovorans TaxID=1084520 RepID=A0ABP8HCE2_9BACT
MKKLLLYTTLIGTLFAAACNSSAGADEAEDSGNEDAARTSKKISRRDVSITRENAYTDLFLDSNAVVQYIAENKVSDSVARRITSFYNARNYQFAWFATDGLTEQARGFWNLLDYTVEHRGDTTLRDKALLKRMNALTSEEKLRFAAGDKNALQTELKLTDHFIRYMTQYYADGQVKRKEMERFVPRKKEEALYLADSLLNKKHKDNKYYEDVNTAYAALKKELARYTDIVKKGGWPTVSGPLKGLKPGDSTAVVKVLKQRLALSGDMAPGDTTALFNDALLAGIRNFQERMGYTPTDQLTEQQLKDLNVPATVRLQQLLMNMERMRWMPVAEESGNLIVANIPEFVLHVYEGKQKAFDMNIVVGKEGSSTMMFNGDLNQVVFSPYWNVPPSIVRDEILPKLASNPGYLDGQNMEQVGNDEGGLPRIRQRPGPDNSLGRVKFLFPNSFNIYFHDTNAKSLFSKDKRAYSHGCIRLEEPEKMAQYLLRNDPSWTPDRIEEAMNSGTEKYVRLKKPVPVVITYYTAWVDERGRLNFRDDIYGHDRDLAGKMFAGNAQTAKR